MFREPPGSSVLLSVAPGPRRWRRPHCLDLLVTCYSGELEGRKQLNTSKGGGGEKRKNKLKNKWPFLVEFGVLIGEAEARGEAGERARKKKNNIIYVSRWILD